MKNRILLVAIFLLTSLYSSIGQTTANTADEDISYMLEEEKLARDVYLALYNKWEHRIFKNISQSEQRHFDKMQALATANHVKIPNLKEIEEAGVFQNEELQKLYHQLVQQGRSSFKNALLVGAKIEELDIRDLKEAINRTDNKESQQVYEYLLQASENHLRAFTRNLEKEDVKYKPVILSEAEFDTIINTTGGKGGKNKKGKKSKKKCKGKKGKGKNCCTT